MTSRALLLIGLLITVTLTVTGASAQAGEDDGDGPGTEDGDASEVKVGIYALSVGNYDHIKGTYTLDFYLIFKWSSGASPHTFEFLNGRTSSKERIFEDLSPGMNETWYRIQANLFINPDFSDYPFGRQDLKIVMEDSQQTTEQVIYSIDKETSGLDPGLSASGWKVDGFSLDTKVHSYPWGEDYSQVVFTIGMVREMGTTVIKTFLPPLIFCIVAGLVFFFRADKITHRLGLGTSMLISSVMFHLSQTSSLPALPSLILMDKLMIVVYVFISCSLLATTIIYIDDEFWKEVDYTKVVNRVGLAVTLILPLLTLGVLMLI